MENLLPQQLTSSNDPVANSAAVCGGWSGPKVPRTTRSAKWKRLADCRQGQSVDDWLRACGQAHDDVKQPPVRGRREIIGEKDCDTGPVSLDELNRDRVPDGLRQAAIRVPAVTVVFWITKGLTTGMGESSSDYLVHLLPPVVAVALGGIALTAALALQFAVRRYVPWIYWLAVAMVGVFGTMAADVLHVGLGVPYLVSTAFFAVTLAVVFVAWYATEKTLSIHSIYTARREVFYWAAVMTTFALGTAAGDMAAVTLKLGYFASGVMFAVVVAIPAVAHRWFGLNAILAFWFAYIATRPLGASFADWMGVSPARRGLDLGAGPVSLALAVLIVGFVVYMTLSHSAKDVVSEQGTRAGR
jgi:uncharacterized membrane-anchored protein